MNHYINKMDNKTNLKIQGIKLKMKNKVKSKKKYIRIMINNSIKIN